MAISLGCWYAPLLLLVAGVGSAHSSSVFAGMDIDIDAIILKDPSDLSQGLTEGDSLDRCQLAVVAEVHERCSSASEETLGKLAVKLYNCQAKVEKRQTYPCFHSMKLSDCTKEMAPVTWNAYLLIANRVKAECFARQQQIWRYQTAETINNLTEQALNSVRVLNELKQGHQELVEAAENATKYILDQQSIIQQSQASLQDQLESSVASVEEHLRRTLVEQEMTLENQKLLLERSNAVQSSVNGAKDALSSMHSDYSGYLSDVTATLNTIRDFESVIADQFFDLHTLAFYLFTGSIIFFVTSVKQTKRMRLYFIALFALEYACERYVSRRWPAENHETARIQHTYVWLSRRVFYALLTLATIASIATYKNMARLTYTTISKIEQQNETILNRISARVAAAHPVTHPLGADGARREADGIHSAPEAGSGYTRLSELLRPIPFTKRPTSALSHEPPQSSVRAGQPRATSTPKSKQRAPKTATPTAKVQPTSAVSERKRSLRKRRTPPGE